MEKVEQHEKLPITEQQIKEFLWWYKRFSVKWKTVGVWSGKTETIFISYEKDGKKYINATNVLMNATWVYNPEENTISVSHDNTNTLWRTLAEDWQLDKKHLENDLKWFKYCFPSRKEKTKQRIKNLFNNKK
jgi:hypothetical protein